ncbi:MAG: caspase family protein [Saprospiraceae bacterium]|nr:caspase family protein [Saprospiraceae bacterium]
MTQPSATKGAKALRKEEHNPLTSGANHYLGIGIINYQHVARLNNAVRDVQALGQLLMKHYGFEETNVNYLLDEEATRRKILKTLRSRCTSLKPEDNLLIYYSGHGHWDATTKSGYWMPVESEPHEIEDFVPNVQVRDLIKAAPCRHILLISDSCFSGSLLVRGTKGSFGAIETWDSSTSRWVFASGKGEVLDGDEGNSPFAKAILWTLEENHTDLNIALLADLVTKQVRFNYDQHAEAAPLQGAGHEGGQFVFRRKASPKKDWEGTDKKSIASLEAFLVRHPENVYANEAMKLLPQLKEEVSYQLSITIEDYLDYLRLYPSGRFQQQAREKIFVLEDEEAWQHALSRNTRSAFLDYQHRFYYGKYVVEASKRLHTRQYQEEEIAWINTKETDTEQVLEEYLKISGQPQC